MINYNIYRIKKQQEKKYLLKQTIWAIIVLIAMTIVIN